MKKWLRSDAKLMSSEQEVQECDARDDDQGTEDGVIKNLKSAIVNLKSSHGWSIKRSS